MPCSSVRKFAHDRFLVVAYLTLLCAPHVGGYVCQLMTPENAPLQQVLGIQCVVHEILAEILGSDVSHNLDSLGPRHCNCTTSFLSGLHWDFTSSVNTTLDAPDGWWYLMDEVTGCVATAGIPPEPIVEPCPPGFYCAGGTKPPLSCSAGDTCPGHTGVLKSRRCPAGYYCPLPGGPVEECADGARCDEGSFQPGPCEAGSYCKDGRVHVCERDHYCPYASTAPRKCSFLAMCARGSKSQGVWPVALLVILGIGCAFCGGAFYYERLTQKGLWVCTFCAAGVASMWLVDVILAGFLTLLLVLFSANWALLRVGAATVVGANVLVLGTFAVALTAIWYVNQSWALLCGGLCAFAGLGYIMSRQNIVLVFIGRGLLVVAFIVLIFVYIKIDPEFMAVVGSFLGLCALGIVASWMVEQRRLSKQGQRMPLPFETRWHVTASQFELGGTGGSWAANLSQSAEQGQCPTTSQGLVPDKSVHNDVRRNGGVGRAEQPVSGSSASGVSFQLDGVNFDLLDGQRLLQDINIVISPGRRVAVMGASGSGKSTLLAVLSGRAAYGRVSGKILVSGQQADDLRFLRSVTGYVPQDDVLHGELTVQENIRFQSALRLPSDTSDAQLEASVKEVATDLNLNAILSSRVGTPELRGVSGGQRKRVSIAMELVSQPQLLFADEPTSGLDSTTSHEVVKCLNSAAGRLGTTVVAVIHQPRYETLCLFDDLVLLGAGGGLVYSGPTLNVVEHFRDTMRVTFPPNANPADILLDAIQNPAPFVDYWLANRGGRHAFASMAQASRQQFVREKVPFFRAALIYMDRAMLQSLRAKREILASQGLCMSTTALLCFLLPYERLDQFMMQCTLAALFLMLLQGVSAQRIFGADLQITWREARVGMPMVAYFISKDLAALFEITLSAAVFTATYGSVSGVMMWFPSLFAGTWAFVYCVFGLNYVFSIICSPGSAQMCAVVSSFLAFCMSGIIQPALPEMAAMFAGRGWMIPALSPVRWMYGYLLTHEVRFQTPLTLSNARGFLETRGYDLDFVHECLHDPLGITEDSIGSLQEAWLHSRGWVCSVGEMLLLGIIFRFLAGLCLSLQVQAQTSGWARFFGQSDRGAWKLAGHLFTLVVGSFLLLFLFAEIWIFGIVKLHFKGYMPEPDTDGGPLKLVKFAANWSTSYHGG